MGMLKYLLVGVVRPEDYAKHLQRMSLALCTGLLALCSFLGGHCFLLAADLVPVLQMQVDAVMSAAASLSRWCD